MHVADVDPDRPGLEIFNVFEERNTCLTVMHCGCGFGEAIFGAYAEEDLGRCMIGDVVPGVRGYQCWVNGVGIYDCKGNLLDTDTPGSNMSIRWSGEFDDPDHRQERLPTSEAYRGDPDWIHGVMLTPENTLTNNGTKGNPCLTADIFGISGRSCCCGLRTARPSVSISTRR